MSDDPTVCIANIGPRERRKRLNAGLVAYAASAALLLVLVVGGGARAWRILLLPLLWGAGLGFFQYREKT